MLSWKHVSLASVASVAFAATAHGLVPAAAAEAAARLQPALFQVSVNRVAQEEPAAALRGPDGAIYIAEAAISAWSMRLRSPPVIVEEGATYVALHEVQGLSFAVDEETQFLSVMASPELLMGSRIALLERDDTAMTPSGKGGFFNYELLGEYSSGDMQLGGAFEVGLFSRHGFGTSTFVAGIKDGEARLIRLDTSWTIDDPERMRSLRLGDSITRGGVGGTPVRFGGVQVASNFAVQPGFVTLPLPGLAGRAALPSVVDIYVDNSLRRSLEVAPGPFAVTDIPVVTGGGDVQFVVRDALGRESVISQSYYASPKMLRKGLHEHSSEMGLLRRNYARPGAGYGGLLLSTTHRYGFSSHFTGEAHLEATRGSQAAGAAGTFLVKDLGLLEASAAASRSDRGTGYSLAFGLEQRTRGFSVGGRGEFTSRNYRTIGDDRLPASKVIQLFAGMPLGIGSLGVSYTLRDGRREADAEIVSANAAFHLGRLGLLHLSARSNRREARDFGAEAGIVIPLGRRTSMNAGARRSDGRTSVTADFQKNLLAGAGVGYRVSAGAGDTERASGRLSAQTETGKYDAEVAMLEGRWGARAVVSGALALVDGEFFAARRLSQSFGVVRVGEFENVRIYADNQLVGKTDEAGRAIVPRLRPFDLNRIEIDLADLPMEAAVAGHFKIVRPYDRSGVNVQFDAVLSRSAILKIVMTDGTDPPAGATARVNGGGEEFVIAPGGEVYLTGLIRRNSVVVHHEGKSCPLDFELPETEDPQPVLGPFTCRN